MFAIEPSKQKQFDASARWSMPDQTRGDHSGIVEDERVADVEKIFELEEFMMFDRLTARIEHHQSGSVARLDRALRNQLLGQFVIKIR